MNSARSTVHEMSKRQLCLWEYQWFLCQCGLDSLSRQLDMCRESVQWSGGRVTNIRMILNNVIQSTLLDRACTCSYKNLPRYRSYVVSNTAACWRTLYWLARQMCRSAGRLSEVGFRKSSVRWFSPNRIDGATYEYPYRLSSMSNMSK